MKRKLNLIFLLVAFSVKAQQYQIFTAPVGQTMRVKWMSKSLESQSFDLMRKESGRDWQKINDKPIVASPVIQKSELRSAKNPFPKDSAYVTYIEYKTTKESTSNKQAFADYTLAMAAVLDNKLAGHLGIYFEDTSVEKGKKYQYKLVDSGSQKERAVSSEASLSDVFAAPSDFKGKQEKQNVRFDWKVDEQYIGYNIYRNGTKANTDPVLANLEGKVYLASYREQDLALGNYKFEVNGITFLGTESQPSAAININVTDQTPPAAIKGFKAERKGSEVTVQWTASADKDVKSYNIFKGAKGKTFQKVNDQPILPTATQFVEKLGPADFGSFQYYLEAVDAAGNVTTSVKTNVFVPDHEAPAMPKSFAFRSESGKISLSWAANTEKDLAGYRIYRGLVDDDQNSMLLLNVTPQTATTFIDSFPKKAKTKFIYKVSALDKAFNESPKASAWIQLPDIEPPAAPVLMEPVASGSEVTLKWSEVLTDAIAGYDVYRIENEKKSKLNDAKITAMTFTDKSLSTKGLYQYYVVAIDSAGLVSKPSNKGHINTAAGKTGEIRLMLSQDASTKKVLVEVVGIAASDVQKIKLYRKDGDTGFRIVPFVNRAEPTVDDTSEPGKIYQYFVEIIDIGDQKVTSDIVGFNNP